MRMPQEKFIAALTAVWVAAIAGLALAAQAAAGPPPTDVKVEDDKFKPAVAMQLLESSTHWIWNDDVAHKHNVREDHKLFYSGPPPRTSTRTSAAWSRSERSTTTARSTGRRTVAWTAR